MIYNHFNISMCVTRADLRNIEQSENQSSRLCVVFWVKKEIDFGEWWKGNTKNRRIQIVVVSMYKAAYSRLSEGMLIRHLDALGN